MNHARIVWNSILELLFPESVGSRKLNSLTPERFAEIAQRANKADLARFNFPVFVPLKYKDPWVRKVIQAAKYRHNTHAARLLAPLLYEELIEEISQRSVYQEGGYTLVPVPLSTKRKLERGYNQVTLLCKEVLLLSEPGELKLDTRLLRRVKKYSKSNLNEKQGGSRKKRLGLLQGGRRR